MNKCRFEQAWRGRCGTECAEGDICTVHKLEKCSECGAPATRECEETYQFVCGASLCEKCTHSCRKKRLLEQPK